MRLMLGNPISQKVNLVSVAESRRTAAVKEFLMSLLKFVTSIVLSVELGAQKISVDLLE